MLEKFLVLVAIVIASVYLLANAVELSEVSA
jgi:hypothetical protein